MTNLGSTRNLPLHTRRRIRSKARRSGTACDQCACTLRCALHMCTLTGPHGVHGSSFRNVFRPRLERAQTRPPVHRTDRARISGGDGSRRSSEEAYVRSCYRGTGCAPRASSASKSAAAVAFGRRARRRGWTVTGANTDVCSLVRVGESAQAKQSAMGLRGRALRRGVWGHSASTCRNVGGARSRTRTITGMVTNRGAGHRRAVITPIPTGCELLLGLPTLLNSGLLTVVMAKMTVPQGGGCTRQPK
jgi:hypothetical protein